MDFSNTRFSFRRPITSYSKVRSIIATIIRNRALHIDWKRVERKEYLDIGCGYNAHDSFINLDYGWHPEVNICWDVTKGLPLRSQSLRGIFTEHCLEHLPFEAAFCVLEECWRVLQPGGSIRIVVPDGELYLASYTLITRDHAEFHLPYFEHDTFKSIYSPIMSINRIFRDDGHLFIYDFDVLQQLLAMIGFTDIMRASFRSGRDPRLLVDTEARAIESLYLEASKPGPALTEK